MHHNLIGSLGSGHSAWGLRPDAHTDSRAVSGVPLGKLLRAFEPPFLCSQGIWGSLKERFLWMLSATLNTTRGHHSVVPGRAGSEARPSVCCTAPAMPALPHPEVTAGLSLGLGRIEAMQGGFGLSWVASNVQNSVVGLTMSTRELHSVDNTSPDFGLWATEGRE